MELLGVVLWLVFGIPLAILSFLQGNPVYLVPVFFFALGFFFLARARRHRKRQLAEELVRQAHERNKIEYDPQLKMCVYRQTRENKEEAWTK